jgi:mRNA interferase MazF
MPDSYFFGETMELEFPFTNAGVGQRPAVVLLDTGDDDLVVTRVTRHGSRDQFDIEIIDRRSAGLRVPSIVTPHRVATLEKRLIGRELGMLSVHDLDRVRGKKNRLWMNV